MTALTTVLSFAGSLIPVLFPDKEFKPTRLAAVVVIFILIGTSVYFMGAENTAAVIELTGDAMDLSSE